MSILRKTGTTAALSVAGVGIAVGGVGLAGAVDTTSGPDASESASAEAGDARAHAAQGRPGHGHGGRGGRGDAPAAGLAEALGLEETAVTAALSAVREQLSSGLSADDESVEGTERTRPTEAERAEHRAQLAAALATELDVTEQEVTAALESWGEERMAAGRTALAERLDVAVADGDLTAADRASVLKAFDAGVLGGERRGR